MSKKKLTVRIPQDLLDNFRLFTEAKNTTMTSLLKNYIRRLPHQDISADTPITRRLSGTLSQHVKIEDYKKHQVEKFDS